MKRLFRLAICIVILCACFSGTAFADTLLSEYWGMDAAGQWHVFDADGNMQKNCWLCDDAAGDAGSACWYLLDEKGCVVNRPVVRDANGYWYSFNLDPAGFSTLRHVDGTYDGIPMEFVKSMNGTFGAVSNQKAISALSAAYPDASVLRIGQLPVIHTSAMELHAASEGALPRTGELYHNPAYLSSSANFTINNSRGTHSLLKIYSSAGDLVSTVFIRRGEKLKIYIPGGTYRLKQAFGDTWYGEKDMFGPGGKYWMCAVNGSYDIPLKRAGVYVLSTTGSGQAITREELDSTAF